MNGLWIDFVVTILVAVYFNTCSFWLLFRPNKIIMSQTTKDLLQQWNRIANEDNEAKRRRTPEQILSDIKVQIGLSHVTKVWGEYIFTYFPMIMIAFTLAVSIFNQSLLSYGYMIFVMVLIEDSKSFFKTEEGGHARLHFILKYLLLPYLLLDILLQLVYQMPFETLMHSHDWSDVIGFGRVWIINPDVVHLGENVVVDGDLNKSLASLMMKGVTFFLISVQIQIVESYPYKKFMLKQLGKHQSDSHSVGRGITYRFNNFKNKQVLKSAEETDQIEKMLVTVKRTIARRENLKTKDNR